jgi:tetratricopeptide (TPR) repeat protein
MNRTLYAFFVILTFACSPKPKEVTRDEPKPVLTSLLGKTFYQPQWSEKTKAKLDSNLEVARKNFSTDPSEENYIWLGRRLAYLYQYDSALRVFTDGISKFPESFRLYRHRGHGYITIRKFDEAINDLQKASELMKDASVEIEPDGAPNKLNQPRSNTQFNVWYHLGLAYYLKGDFYKAETSYLECLNVSDNDDLITATVDWLYMTYRRENKKAEADQLLRKIKNDMNIIENDSYYKRLQMYQGKMKPGELLTVKGDDEEANLALATQGYGLGNWYFYNGQEARATEIFKKVVEGEYFSAFGFIAAEAELSRMKK